MEIRHSRTPSFPSASARPSLVRRGSTASEAGSVASEMPEVPGGSAAATSHVQLPPTPTSNSIPSTPVASGMNPPPPGSTSGKPGSRRSSFSSQAAGSPALSVTNLNRGRSPSPIPPLPAIRQAPATSISQRLYGEEGVTRFFRRLTFSPDGGLLLTPAGQVEDQVFKGSPLMASRSLSHEGTDGLPAASAPRPRSADVNKPTVYIYSRANLARAPVAHLPGHKTASVCIRFSPIFYDLRTGSSSAAAAEPKHITLDASNPAPVFVTLSMPPPPPPATGADKSLGSVFTLPYRLMYAVACQDAVLLYDTQQVGPVAIFRGLHYAGFTDIAWSPDGQAMMLSSADGYCSIVVFDLGELGTVHPTQQHHRQLAAIAHSHGGSATAVPQSPSIARVSPAPPRSERESSVASSAAHPPPLFPPSQRPPSSASSDQPLPTPSEEPDPALGLRRPSTESDTSVQEAPRKKRRVQLTQLAEP